MKTWNAKPEEIEAKWWIVDATDQTLGRLACAVALILTGKNKPTFTPNVDTGDFVVLINADKIRVTGNKLGQKRYYRHSRYFGGLKSFTGVEMLGKEPTFIVEEAIKGMLPKSKLGRKLLLKLKAYKGADHPHSAQKPQALKLN